MGLANPNHKLASVQHFAVLHSLPVRVAQLLTALFEHALAIAGDQFLYRPRSDTAKSPRNPLRWRGPDLGIAQRMAEGMVTCACAGPESALAGFPPAPGAASCPRHRAWRGPATMTGFSAFTSILAEFLGHCVSVARRRSRHHVISGCGSRRSSADVGSSCSAPSATMHHGLMGGVIAILYKRARRTRRSAGARPAYRPTWCSRAPWRGILHAVRPFDVAAAPWPHRSMLPRIGNRDAVGVSVVDGHRSVLQAHRAVRHHHHRLAFDLGVAVRHRHRRFFVAAGEQFGILVAAVVDQGFVQSAETRTGIGGDIFEAQGLENIDHEVGAGPVVLVTSAAVPAAAPFRKPRRSTGPFLFAMRPLRSQDRSLWSRLSKAGHTEPPYRAVTEGSGLGRRPSYGARQLVSSRGHTLYIQAMCPHSRLELP
jgi:hypothetical protein